MEATSVMCWFRLVLLNKWRFLWGNTITEMEVEMKEKSVKIYLHKILSYGSINKRYSLQREGWRCTQEAEEVPLLRV